MTTLPNLDDVQHHHRRGLNPSCREHTRVTQLPEPLSPSYRSQSEEWNTTTEANTSSMNRNRTRFHKRSRHGQGTKADIDTDQMAFDQVLYGADEGVLFQDIPD